MLSTDSQKSAVYIYVCISASLSASGHLERQDKVLLNGLLESSIVANTHTHTYIFSNWRATSTQKENKKTLEVTRSQLEVSVFFYFFSAFFFFLK